MAIKSPPFQFPPDAEATVTFLVTEQGGKMGPVRTDYRPQFYYGGRDWDAVHEYPDADWVYPGQTARALLRFLSPREHLGHVVPGLEFAVREGARTVARGVITRVLGLEESAKRQSASDVGSDGE